MELFLGRADRADAGVVDQDVDPPEPLDHLLDRGGGRGVTGHVEARGTSPLPAE